jgi:exodeoxyribonuclease VII large subunit
MNTAVTQKPQPVLTVSQLTLQIKGMLDSHFQRVAVVGEVSNFKGKSRGHWYFCLKDDVAMLSCVCFSRANSGVRFDLQDGLKVVARGRLEVYPPKGGYQLIITHLEPVGIGQWQLAFDQLKERLSREGLLEAGRKRAIPLMPRKIGVVTSTKAAALHDVLTALKRRNPNVAVVISPTRVQGDAVEHEIAHAIYQVQKVPDVEVVLVVRGGGSIEDLWCFNTEVVARAVAACRVPVISGVGHETDITICDLVADLRAPTPTAAAELVSRGRAELVQRWSNLTRLLCAKMEHRLSNAHRTVERLDPRHALASHQERLKKLAVLLRSRRDGLEAHMSSRVSNLTNRWHRLDEKLRALSPLSVLSRGFAILRLKDQTVVRNAEQVLVGDVVEAWLSQGRLKLRVVERSEDWT